MAYQPFMSYLAPNKVILVKVSMFGLVWFYGISTILGYLMPNPFLYKSVLFQSLTSITQECCEQYWTSAGSKTPQNNSHTVTYHPSRKLSKLDEPDMQIQQVTSAAL